MGYFLLMPGSDLATYYYFPHQDKAAHLVLFSGWSFFMYLALMWEGLKSILSVVILGSMMAALTEWAQRFVPQRSSDLNDFLFDMAGVTLGVFIGYLIKKELLPAEKKFDK